MQAMTTPTLPSTSATHERWISRRHVVHWLTGFRSYFPRKAHLAERAAARLGGCDSAAELYSLLEPRSAPDEASERDDMLYARRRMVLFRQDRLILITEFGILPDAADIFLTACPVGCGQCVFKTTNFDPFDPRLSYYGDDQLPSERMPLIIEQQYEDALGQQLMTVDSTQRLGDYLHPSMLVSLFQFLRWDVTFDTDSQDNLGAVPATHIGWASDTELGSIDLFSLRFTAPPVWSRDEVFWSVLRMLRSTCDLRSKPVVLLNNRPMQLMRGGHTYTSFGWLVIESRVMPLLVNQQGHSLSSLLIELVTFNPMSSVVLEDEANGALSVFWSLLRATTDLDLPPSPSFRCLPDGWMVP